MKTIMMCMMACVMMMDCSAENYPILHPDQQKATAKDYPCGLHADQYSVKRNDKVVKVCCPEGLSPNNQGYCH